MNIKNYIGIQPKVKLIEVVLMLLELHIGKKEQKLNNI